MDYVFGYASLVSQAEPADAWCLLRGYRRRWDVAMDNRVTIPGYKYYVDARTGERPPVFVAFLNVARKTAGLVNGLLVPAGDNLADLDRRERCYRRVEVTDDVWPVPPGRVFTYVGSPEGRQRYEQAVTMGACAVQRRYHDGVLEGFARGGAAALAQFRVSTNPPGCPLLTLRRIEVPLGGGPSSTG